MDPTQPQDGLFVAWNGFDGDGPMQLIMSQDVTLPAGRPAVVTWMDRVQWEFFGGSLAKTYDVTVRNPATGALLGTLASVSTGDPYLNYSGDTRWQSHSVELSDFAGQTIRLSFEESIPESYVGLGQIEFDAIRLFVGGELTVPDVDEFEVDLTGKVGHTIDIILSGQGKTDYASARLDLLGPDGATVLASAAGDPLGVTADNYDLAILDFVVEVDGVYTLRMMSNIEGQYGLIVTDSLVFDSEPNDTAGDPLRSLDDVGAALGMLGHGGGGTPLLFGIDWADPTPTNIMTLDPADASTLTSFPSPSTPSTNPYGYNLAFDGTYLWYNAGASAGDNTVYQLDAQTGDLLESFTASNSGLGMGLAYLGGEIFYSNLESSTIDVYSVSDFAYSRTLSIPAGAWGFEGLAGDDLGGHLYGISQFDGVLYRMDPQTGEVLDSASTSPMGFVQGLGLMGDELFVSETNGIGALNEIAVYDRQSLALLRRMPVGVTNMISGLGADGAPATFPAPGASPALLPEGSIGKGDLYEISLAAGQTIVMTTETPLDRSGNDLNPALALSHTEDLIVNGGFETGDFTGWTALNNGLGETLPWTVDSGSGTANYPVLITEAGTSTPDFFEIQNFTSGTIDTTGWVVAANNAANYNINAVHDPLWSFPASVAPDQLIYRPDTAGDNIFWRTRDEGWVMILDDQGNVVDFVVWGYSDVDLASFEVNVGSFEGIRVDDAWNGPAVSNVGATSDAVQRIGGADHNNASDWTFDQESSGGEPNEGLTTFSLSSSPHSGAYSAYNGFEGEAGLQYELFQDVTIPADIPSALLTTNHRIAYAKDGASLADRILEISIRDTDDNLLETLYTENILVSGPAADLGWNTQTFELASYAGQTVRIHFEEFVPESFTGAAIIEFDDIRLLADSVVAFDSDTEDGKNSRLVFTATDSDTYLVQVLPEDGGGEYLLQTQIYDQRLPWVRIEDVEVAEGDSGITQAVLTVSLSEDPSESVTVRLDTFDDTATVVDDDYQPISDMVLTFDPGGSLSQQVVVNVPGDTQIEPTETFISRLSNVTSAIIADPHSVGTILNDDTVILVVEQVELLEGDSGVALAGFAISLVAPAGIPVTVQYTTVDGTATVADLDYLPIAGTLTFEPYETEKTLTVDVLSDTQIEAHETLFLNFSDPSQPIDRLQSLGTLLNDDTEISIEDVTAYEGDAETTDFVFTVSLAAASALPVTVQVDTADRTATVKDHDYLPIDSLELTFDPDETSKTLTVSVNGDTKVEADETFRVTLNHASQPIARSQALGTILNDDSLTTAVVGRHIFYNNSAWDNPAKGDSDDQAIAADKAALLPGGIATFANYTSHVRGINGIMVDIADLPGTITADDFEFRVGNDDNLTNWESVATAPTVDVHLGTVSRVTITWPDYTIQNEWLQVTVLAGENTGLTEPDVFYFGNLAGECTGDGKVDAFDVLDTRSNPRPFFDPATLDTAHDFNRDKRVNAIDTLIARNNQTVSIGGTGSTTELTLLDLAVSKAAKSNVAVGTSRAMEHLYDSALRQVLGRRAKDLEVDSVKADWLYELELDDSHQGRSDDRTRVQRALEELLTHWP